MASGYALNRNRKVPAEETPAFGAIAERFRRAGDLERAIALCQDGLRRFPDHLSARVTLGWSLLDLGRYDEAREALEQVLKRAPDNLAAIRGLAELHDRAEHTMMLPMDGPGQWPPVVEQTEEAPAAFDETAESAADQFEFPPALAIPIPASLDAPPADEAASDAVADAIAMVADAMADASPATPVPPPDPLPVAAMASPEAAVETPVFVTSSGAPLQVTTPDIDAMIAAESAAAEPAAVESASDALASAPLVESPPVALAAEPEPVVAPEFAFDAAVQLEPAAPLDLAAESTEAEADLVQLATDDLETMTRELSAEAPVAALDVEEVVSEEMSDAVEPAAAFSDEAATEDPDEIAALEALIAQAADDRAPGFELQPQSMMALQAMAPVSEAAGDEDAPPFVPEGQQELPLAVAAAIAIDEGPVFALEAQSILALMSAPPAEDELEDEPDTVPAASGEMPLIAACEAVVDEPAPIAACEVVVDEPAPIAVMPVEPPRRSPLAALEGMLRRVQARRMQLVTESVA